MFREKTFLPSIRIKYPRTPTAACAKAQSVPGLSWLNLSCGDMSWSQVKLSHGKRQSFQLTWKGTPSFVSNPQHQTIINGKLILASRRKDIQIGVAPR